MKSWQNFATCALFCKNPADVSLRIRSETGGGQLTQKLAGKIAVITGGSSGIGLATAKRFVDEGAHVFITGRRKSELDRAVNEIGRNVTGVHGDVAKMADIER